MSTTRRPTSRLVGLLCSVLLAGGCLDWNPGLMLPDAGQDATIPDSTMPIDGRADGGADGAASDAKDDHGSDGGPDLPLADGDRPDAQVDAAPSDDAPQPDLGQPDLGQPDVAQPDLAQPDVAQPDIAQPDIAHPDLAQPDVLPADTVPPDTLMTDGGMIVLSEDFEAGLSGWTLSGAGSVWAPQFGSGIAGSGAAVAQKTGATTPSYLERPINLAGYATATFAYARRLVGLDGADDFAAQYFASGSWIAVEQLGAASANDGSFVSRSFTIPATATAIRFMCQCGAASEACYVDAVVVRGF